MNIVEFESPLKAQEVAATSMDEFLYRIQNIITNGGHKFLIQRSQLEKLTSLQINHTIANSQNFLATGLIQLREELHTHIGTNQENLKKGIERFFQVFTEYQINLSQALGSLAAQLKPIGEHNNQNLSNLYEMLTSIDNRLKFELSQTSEKVEQTRINLATARTAHISL